MRNMLKNSFFTDNLMYLLNVILHSAYSNCVWLQYMCKPMAFNNFNSLFFGLNVDYSLQKRWIDYFYEGFMMLHEKY